MTLFDAAVELTLDAEGQGRISNDPRDPGGLTRWGISQRAYPTLDIANLTREEAVALYYRDYWNAVRAHGLPPGVALLVFDFAVNSGPRRSIVSLQRALGVQVDGVMGNLTTSAARGADVLALITEFSSERAAFVAQISRPGTPTRGLLRRVVVMTVHAMEWTLRGAPA